MTIVALRPEAKRQRIYFSGFPQGAKVRTLSGRFGVANGVFARPEGWARPAWEAYNRKMRRFLNEGEPWQVIGAFAAMGFAVAGACYAYAALYDYAKPMTLLEGILVLVSVVLCPPQLLFMFCIDCEVIGWDGFIMYAIIGALNAGLYALIGLVVVSLRRPSADSSDLSQTNK